VLPKKSLRFFSIGGIIAAWSGGIIAAWSGGIIAARVSPDRSMSKNTSTRQVSIITTLNVPDYYYRIRGAAKWDH